MNKSTRLRIAALFVITLFVIFNAIVLAYLVVKSDGPDNGLTECVQKTKSVELCATAAYRQEKIHV